MMKSSKVCIPVKVSGNSTRNEYQKIAKPSGKNGEPLRLAITLPEHHRMEKLITNQKMRPRIPISTTSVP